MIILDIVLIIALICGIVGLLIAGETIWKILGFRHMKQTGMIILM